MTSVHSKMLQGTALRAMDPHFPSSRQRVRRWSCGKACPEPSNLYRPAHLSCRLVSPVHQHAW